LATVHEGGKIQHDVQDWMLDALDIAMARAFESSGQLGYFIEEVEQELAYVATLHFRQAMFLEVVPEEDRRLTIMLTGYMNDGRIIHTLISNCLGSPTAQAEFKFMPTVLKSPANGEPSLIQAIGQIGEFTAEEEHGIRELLEGKAPAETILNHAAPIVESRHKRHGTVDRTITAAILKRDAPELPMLEYRSNAAGDTRAFLDFVRGKKGQPVKLSKSEFGMRIDEEDFILQALHLHRDTATFPRSTLTDARQQIQSVPAEDETIP
jgi:hypothetical protein